MLKVDCNAVLNNNKSILIDSEAVKELLDTLDNQYNGLDASVKERASINTGILRGMVSYELEDKISFLSKMVKELEEAMGESMDDLIKHKYGADVYEDKIIAFYADHWYKLGENLETQDDAYKHFYVLDIFYDFWHKDTGMDEKLNTYLSIREFQEKFDYDRFGLNPDDVRKQLLYIKDVRGFQEMELIIKALLNNCPDNFEDYDFQPGRRINSDSYYNFDSNHINEFQTNSEILSINGYDFEFCQVLPKDCTGIEMLAYNFAKANVINTMRTLPSSYLEVLTHKNNTVILTCSNDSQIYNGEVFWGGLTYPGTGNVVINVHESFKANYYYTVGTVLHEFGHKFDAILVDSFINKLFGKYYYSKNNETWQKLYNKYVETIQGIEAKDYDNLVFGDENENKEYSVEFFAGAMYLYFTEGDAMKKFCPDLYEEITRLLGEDYSDSYNEHIEEVLNTEYDGQSKGNGYSDPEPGPGPSPTPGPEVTPGPNN
jgi:hypothetical protein